MYSTVSRLRGALHTSAVSGLSSVDIQQIGSRRKGLDEASTAFYKTSSIQVKQGNYPRSPRIDEDNDIFACEWCGEPLNKKKLSETDWRYVLFVLLVFMRKHHKPFGKILRAASIFLY